MDGDGSAHEVSEGYRDYLEWEQAICTIFWQQTNKQKTTLAIFCRYPEDLSETAFQKKNALIIYLEEEILRQNSVMGKFAYLDSF